MKKVIVSAIVVLTTLTTAAHAETGPKTQNFQVKITVNESCNFTSAKDIDFAEIDRSTSSIKTASGQLNITCTLNTPYKIALAGKGEMSSQTIGSNSKIAYKLYQDATNITEWDEKNLLSKTGDGNNQIISVFAKLSGNTNVEAGTYADTVVATVTY